MPARGQHLSEEAKRAIGLANSNPSEETRRKISEGNMGNQNSVGHKVVTNTPEFREALSKRMLGNTYAVGHVQSEEQKRAASERMLGKTYAKGVTWSHSEESKRAIGDALRGKEVSEETRELLRLASLGNRNMLGYAFSEESRQQMSESHKDTWASLSQEEKDNWQRRAAQGCKDGPTEPEWLLGLCLERHFSGKWAYNGHGEQGVVLKSRVPDFINIDGKKAVIEVFGSYHHNPDFFPGKEAPEELVARYARLGFKCLVLWDDECCDVPETVERIREL